MARLVKQGRVELTATLELNETELRALDALAGYGTDAFIKAFYEKIGKHYLEPHEKGIRSLFETVQKIMPSLISRTDRARSVFNGEMEATYPKVGKKAL